MKKKVVIVVTILVILAAAVVFAMVFKSNTDRKENKENIELSLDAVPSLTVYYGEESIGTIEGYTMEMNASHMRDVIVPISTQRRVPIKIKVNDNEIRKISYEVYDLSKDNLIDNGDIKVQNKIENGVLPVDYIASPIMDIGKEYSLRIIIDTDEHNKVYYYTRVMIMNKDDVIPKQLQFAKRLSQDTMSEERGIQLQAYLEPDSKYPNDNLGQVTIRNILKMLLWGSMSNIEREGRVETSIKDICIKDTGEAVTYTLLYKVKSKNTQKIEETYNIAETITVWNFSGKQYILSYNREMNQIWEANENNVGNTFIDFGIQKQKEVDHVESENRQNIAWEINGDVYSMNVMSKKVLSIYNAKAANSEKLYKTRSKVIKVSDNGDTEYMIYGYSPTDKHIGKNGISIMKFSAEKKESKELVFIPVKEPAQVLQSQMSQLCYEGDKTVYIMLDNTVYFANIKTKEFGVLVDKFEEGACVANDEGNIIAYNTDGTRYGSDSITVVDLTNGNKKEISGNGRKVTVCGYTGDNLVYGVGENYSPKKQKRFPMRELKIVDKDLKEVKSYAHKNITLSDVEVTDTVISFKRWKNGREIDEEQLLDNTEEKVVVANSSYYIDDIKMKELVLSFVNNLASDVDFKFEKATDVGFGDDTEVEATFDNNKKERFYAYSTGKLIGIFEKENDAIAAAKENYGLVCNENGAKIWTFEENYNR